MRVVIIMGSKNDWEIMRHSADTLNEFGVSYLVEVLSAHRTPNELVQFVKNHMSDTGVFIAGAGMAAHLAGAIAAHTVKPVLGVPLSSSPLNGMDSLFSTVQMPAGIPVATFAIGKSGAINAALFAVSILSLSETGLSSKLIYRRVEKAKEILSSYIGDK